MSERTQGEIAAANLNAMTGLHLLHDPRDSDWSIWTMPSCCLVGWNGDIRASEIDDTKWPFEMASRVNVWEIDEAQLDQLMMLAIHASDWNETVAHWSATSLGDPLPTHLPQENTDADLQS
jgi:hypothetical protein